MDIERCDCGQGWGGLTYCLDCKEHYTTCKKCHKADAHHDGIVAIAQQVAAPATARR